MFWDSGTSRLFWRFRQVSSPCFGFPRFIRSTCIYSVFEFVFIFCIGLCPYTCMWPSAQDCICTMPVTNACTSVVSFLCKCHACDVVYYFFIIYMWLTLTLRQVLYPALGCIQPPALTALQFHFSFRALNSRFSSFTGSLDKSCSCEPSLIV